MEPKIINFTADNQMLVNQTGSICLASGTVEYVGAHFELGENWSGFDSIISVWANFRTVKTAVLDPDGNCQVPTEVLAQKGTVLVNLVGSKVEDDVVVERLTTCKIEAATIGCDANLTGSETVPVTPSQFEQFVAIVIAEVEKVTGMTAVAETLPPGSLAYARYEDGVLYLGIPEGAQGEAGADGADGNGISLITLNADYTLTISYTDGTSTTVGPIRGAEGPEGPRGPQGEPGQDGVTPVFSIGNVETLPAGSDAEASITGTPEAPVLNLGIPKGDPGEVTMETLEQILPTDTASGAIASFPDGSDLFPAKSVLVDIDPVQDGTPWISDIYRDPYLQKFSPQLSNEYNRLFDMIVGGTVAWNQLIQNGNFESADGWNHSQATATASGNVLTTTLIEVLSATQISRPSSSFKPTNGHKYLAGASINPPKATTCRFQYPSIANGTRNVSVQANTWNRITNIFESIGQNGFLLYYNVNTELAIGDAIQFKDIICIDLTQMFGSTIADYIYSLEQATAGAGVAWFKNLFPADYYPYNAGELMSVGGLQSHDVTGKNLLNLTESGMINQGWNRAFAMSMKAGTYTLSCQNRFGANDTTYGQMMQFNDADNNRVKIFALNYNFGNTVMAETITLTEAEASRVAYLLFQPRANFMPFSQIANAQLQLELGSTATAYEPYFKNSYPLDSTLTLRGIPKLDSNNKLYYDGDGYRSDGVVTRKYGIVDLGERTWLDSTVSGGGNRFYSTFGIAKSPSSLSEMPNIICSALPTKLPSTYDGKTEGITIHTNGSLQVYSSAFESMSASEFKSAMSGVMLVYELATPTTESANPFTNPQYAEPGGFEEYVDNRSVQIPVGNKSFYMNEALISGWTGANIVVSPTADAENGTIYNVTWQTEAGIVYDGTVDIVSGKLTVTWANVDMGSLSWASNGAVTGGMQYAVAIAERKIGERNLLCSCFYILQQGESYQSIGGMIGRATTKTVVCNSAVTDRNAFIASVSGQQLVYELEEPVEYQLTEQEVEILLGQNNIWANTGDTSVTYKADIQRYIEKKLA